MRSTTTSIKILNFKISIPERFSFVCYCVLPWERVVVVINNFILTTYGVLCLCCTFLMCSLFFVFPCMFRVSCLLRDLLLVFGSAVWEEARLGCLLFLPGGRSSQLPGTRRTIVLLLRRVRPFSYYPRRSLSLILP